MVRIDVSNATYRALQARAKAFEDTPDIVIRRLLDEIERGRRRSELPGDVVTRSQGRAPVGSILPESEYESPILEALVAAEGRAAAHEVIEEVGRRLKNRLTERDHEMLPGDGGIRWKKRTQFARLNLVRRGLLSSDSPRGVWELTEAGVAEARR